MNPSDPLNQRVPIHPKCNVTVTNCYYFTARSYEPPKRDEEAETQRKARAKRARETRRSTQVSVLSFDISVLNYIPHTCVDHHPSPGKKLNQLFVTTVYFITEYIIGKGLLGTCSSINQFT